MKNSMSTHTLPGLAAAVLIAWFGGCDPNGESIIEEPYLDVMDTETSHEGTVSDVDTNCEHDLNCEETDTDGEIEEDTVGVCPGDLVPVDGECIERREPLHLGPGWNEIRPGGATTCVYGDEYAFYVRKGTVNRLLFFMQGGGACWDELTCNIVQPFNKTVSMPGNSGILDPDNPDNPFKDWHVIYVPYCSADVSFGNTEQVYIWNKVQHRGFVNAESARHWAYENVTAPEFIFVSGCSAGAVGVIMHGAYMMEAYKENTEIDGAMVTDSFQGIIPDGFAGIDRWDVPANVPPWFPQLKEPPFNMVRAILEGMPRYPQTMIAHFNYASDATQALFYGYMGGNPFQMSNLISEAVHTLADQLPNYRFYTAPGANHCVFESDGVFSTEVDGVNLAKWLGGISRNEDVVSVE